MKFADTSFWVALQVPRDRHHEDAAALWRAGTGPLLTSQLVLGETWTFLRRRAGHEASVRFLDRVAASAVVAIERTSPADEDEAWSFLRRRDERAYSFVDATSFAIMRRRRMREALAFDGDFSAAGFVEARP